MNFAIDQLISELTPDAENQVCFYIKQNSNSGYATGYTVVTATHNDRLQKNLEKILVNPFSVSKHDNGKIVVTTSKVGYYGSMRSPECEFNWLQYSY